MKKVGAREVVQCSNDNHFWVLYINFALSSSPVGLHTVADTPNIATNKSNKTLCNQMPKDTTE